MKLLALLTALLLEQFRPLRADNALHAAYGRFAQYLQHQFDAGQYRQGVVAWLLAVVPLILLALLCQWQLAALGALPAWLFAAAVLYVTVGFRRNSDLFNKINNLLKFGEVASAREPLQQWCHEDCSEFDANAVARVTIEQGLLSSHRQVFGPMAWFLVFGAAGALLYCAAALLQAAWYARRTTEPAASDEFARFAARAFEIIDWLPARLSAASFAVVGNFQDAVDCWRAQAVAWPDLAQGILLASGAGALGVRLGGPLPQSGQMRDRPELGSGDEADVDYLSSAVGLVWRALVMWMLLLAAVTLANALG